MNNREIKFRRYFQHDETGRITSKLWGNIDHKENSVYDFSVFTSPATIGRWYPVCDCQFIGLKDKNGIEIYEGDICKMRDQWYEGDYTEYGFIGVVKYEDGEFGIHGKGEYQYEPIESCTIHILKIEVIGNIYENPELLENDRTTIK